MTTKDFAGSNEALPNDAEMRLYARAYSGRMAADELFLRWEAHLAHGLLLEQAPDRDYPEYGLNSHQLAEGARLAARRMALLLAEAPAEVREVLAMKIHVFETMAQLPTEGTASNTIFMVETAMKSDAERFNIVLLPMSHRPAQAQ
ncbi:hypothetical protein [Bosea sp. Root381]|uniref:hypothetical protein n=1 Tax=Bosea sp. Root381 TaxID=1736524 RepID=UPI000A99E949|nr:hypothetical protein [Bosea sp. Root381]